MDKLIEIVQTITGMGASAILPIIITIIGLVFRMKLGDAIKAGLTVGVGFIGLTLVVGLLNTSLDPAVEYYWLYHYRHWLAGSRCGFMDGTFCGISDPDWLSIELIVGSFEMDEDVKC